MLIAILADTHDNARTTRAAIELLRPRGVAAWLHCGDMCDPAMLDLFTGLPLWFVYGNNDFDHAGLKSAAAATGAKCLEAFGQLTLAGKKIALLHGDDFARRRGCVESGIYDYVLSGHTHKKSDLRAGRTRDINPGALYRAIDKTVALLNLATDELEFLTVQAGGGFSLWMGKRDVASRQKIARAEAMPTPHPKDLPWHNGDPWDAPTSARQLSCWSSIP